MGWLPLMILVGLLIVAAVLIGGAAAVILVFVAVVLVLDRAIGFTGWGLAEAEQSFARLIGQRRREELKSRLRRRPRESNQLACLSEDAPEVACTTADRGPDHRCLVDRGNGGTREGGGLRSLVRPPHWSRGHWTRMWIAGRRGAAMPQISVCRVGEEHYVRDGHHRVSVMRALGALDIDADVTELDRGPSSS